MKKNDDFIPIVARLDKIVSSSEEKSLNTFTKNVLHYPSSEKLSRIFRENITPSLDVVIDFKNAYPHLNLNWLLTGQGEMFHIEHLTPKTTQDPGKTAKSPSDELRLRDDVIALQKKIIEMQEGKEGLLLKRLDELARDQQVLQSTLDDGLRVVFDAVLGLKKESRTENLESIFRKKLLEIGQMRKQDDKTGGKDK